MATDGDIGEMVRDRAIAGVPGLGKTLVARVTELVTTGHLTIYEDLLAKVPPGLRQMLRIPGLGPKRMRQISQALNISTLAELQAPRRTRRVASLPGFGAKSQENILKGIQFLEQHAEHRYPVAEEAASRLARLRGLPGWCA